ncbi:ECF family sigma factor [Bordetella ansorpii]|uniref:ECF family sigma factor n=1 Tax=Bordetella ansorpii TaxID=288768 RepID=A0A157S6C3_9BORD|nr:RNA polymerase sigma factor [Bordetella ansorpii]SAI65813.1 ECF family sigma factor [Bordetella ansorpii]
MSDCARTTLRLRLAARYAELRARLERMVGSRDAAAEALQETWLRLGGGAQTGGPVHNPDAYLLRMAANIATDAFRRDSMLVSDSEREALLHIADEVADPARIVTARRDLAALEAALAELPPRRRAILAAARVDGLLNSEIAERFEVSVATVKKELQQAMKHCRERLSDTQAVQDGSLTGRRKF